MLNRYAEMMADGYIFVFQDIRGRFGSEGKFVMLRPSTIASDPKGDRREHRHLRHHRLALKNVPHNNGRVGMLGISLRRLAHRDGRCSIRTPR